MNPLRTVFLTLAIVSIALAAQAQPPDISRWAGNTANSQAQGFAQGSPLRLTWGFAALGTPINDSAFSGVPNANNSLQTRLNSIYGSQAVWQPIFQSTFNRWSSISGLTFDFEAADDGAPYIVNTNQTPLGQLGIRADIRIGGKPIDGNGGILAYNYFPSFGDMVIDTNDATVANTANDSQALRYILTHELGHALGMPHVVSDNAAFLLEPFIQSGFDGPAYHDILVAQRGYGDALEKSNSGLGNDTTANATDFGSLVFNDTRSIGNDARNFATNAATTDFVSIDSDTDTDFFKFTIADAGLVNITLDSLGFTYLAGPQTGGSQVAFNTAQRSDLRFSLLGPDGLTSLADVNGFGLGMTESLLNFALNSAGTYFIRIQGTSNSDAIALDTQFYGLQVNFITAVPEPSSFALLAMVGGAIALRKRLRRGKTNDAERQACLDA